jgi:predicted nucleotidyltransferase component of viral defense system
MKEIYQRTVELLLDIAPRVFEAPDLAMKGGTAINLFIRDLPRLSVDIDLVYLPREHPREQAMAAIDAELQRISERVRRLPGVAVQSHSGGSGEEVRILVSRGGVGIKVEVNHVFRGAAYPIVRRRLMPKASALFRREVAASLLDEDEIYGSKLVAAMARQHPRDIFDVMLLLEEGGGITPRMRRAFVVYVAGHNRPMGELLTPRVQPIADIFRSEFAGMTTAEVSLEQLEETRRRYLAELPASLDEAERRFLLSMKAGEPQWDLLGIPGLAQLPALQWKLQNLQELRQRNPKKHQQLYDLLKQKLGL